MILQRAARKADATFRWTIRPWKSDILRLPPGADEALMEAIDAHLIVVAGYRAQTLPSWLNSWLERWAACRKIKSAALAVIRDQRSETLLTSAMRELFQLAVRHGLDFIANREAAVEDGWTLFSRGLSKSDELPFSVQPHLLTATEVNTPSHWGISISSSSSDSSRTRALKQPFAMPPNSVTRLRWPKTRLQITRTK